MEHKHPLNKTPWQRVHAKFGLSAAALASGIGRHRSKVSRALRDSNGLINGSDQKRLLEFARTMNVEITPDDLTPAV